MRFLQTKSLVLLPANHIKVNVSERVLQGLSVKQRVVVQSVLDSSERETDGEIQVNYPFTQPDVANLGCIGQILAMKENDKGFRLVLIAGLERCKILSWSPSLEMVKVERLVDPETFNPQTNLERALLLSYEKSIGDFMDSLRNQSLGKKAEKKKGLAIGENLKQLERVIDNGNPYFICDFLMNFLDCSPSEKQSLLNASLLEQRLETFIKILENNIQVL
jgi:ATP-dependent Lon protease